MATATIRISGVEIDPLRRDRLRRWLVTGEVITVDEGEFLDEVVTMLVHSPARDFRDVEIVGNVYRVTLPDDVAQPYTGPFTAERID